MIAANVGRTGNAIHTISVRNRWVGKSGRIRREGMELSDACFFCKHLLETGKRVNFCARSVVTCDSHLSAAEVMLPRVVIHRLTTPVVVHSFNRLYLMECMRRGEVPFIQRAGVNQKMRSGNLNVFL